MIGRRALTIAGLTWLADTSFVWSQQIGRVRRIGVLAPGSVPDPTRYPEPLLAGLRDLGWIEGENIAIERRIAGDRTGLLPAMAEDLVARKCEVIVTIGTPAAIAARKATATVPIVMATIGDPVSAGLVASLARPGGNATGNTFIEPNVGAKRLQVLKELLPGAVRIGELMNPSNPAMQALRAGEIEALRTLGLEAIVVDVVEAGQLEAAFAEFKAKGAQAAIVHADSLFVSHRARIMGLALERGLPTMAEGRHFVEAGALLSYAPNSAWMIRNAVVFVDKILRGANPADLPVEQPTRFEFVVNAKTAAALGVTIPPSLLARTDEVIE
jgi:putative ABC transport system substrate-binding protein